jgi:hypothetical protein
MLKAKGNEINEQEEEKYLLSAQNCPLVPGGVSIGDKRTPFCHGW